MIVLNELQFAEDCLKKEHVDKPYYMLTVLAKYYYHHLNYNKEVIKKELKDFLCDKYMKYKFEEKYWEENISKIVKNVDKQKFYKIQGVCITESELEIIEKQNNLKIEKLIFTMLCLAKLAVLKNDKNTGWVNKDLKTIFKLARIQGGITERELYICKLYNRGLIDLPKRNDVVNYKITFIDDESKNKIFVQDFRELGYEYLKYKGENIIRCGECGILIKGNKNKTRKYCSNCAAYTPKMLKNVICTECGNTFKVVSKNTKTHRCPICSETVKKNKKK